jgi:hypothetical protein
MVLASLLFMFRTQVIKKNIPKILFYDYQAYDGDPDQYFSMPGSEVINPDKSIQIEHEGVTENVTTTERRLQLKDNDEHGVEVANARRDTVLVHNYLNRVDFTGSNKDIIEGGLNTKNHSMISIPDYDALSPRDLIQYDKRTPMAYFKDILIVDHTILSLIFRKSLKDPLFIRVVMLVFNLSMQFALNAMVYTDDVIDQKQIKQDVSIYLS